MAADSYRKPALALVQQPFLEPYDGKGCPACGKSVTGWPEWQQKSVVDVVKHICFGGRWGFLWHRYCFEFRPHTHRRCTECGAKWLNAVKRPAYYEK